MVWRPFVHLVGVGVGELACLLLLFLLCSSPIFHLALIGLVTILVAHVANHDLSFIKLLHSLDGVILMKLGLLHFALHLSQALGEVSHFLNIYSTIIIFLEWKKFRACFT